MLEIVENYIISTIYGEKTGGPKYHNLTIYGELLLYRAESFP